MVWTTLLFSWKCSQVSSIFKTNKQKKDLAEKNLIDRSPFGEACNTLFSPDHQWRELSYPSLCAGQASMEGNLHWSLRVMGAAPPASWSSWDRFHSWLSIPSTRSCYREWHKHWACSAATAAFWHTDELRGSQHK